jgi:hypothetical protein
MEETDVQSEGGLTAMEMEEPEEEYAFRRGR